ncbi:hypothetical protein QBC39DRAFT_373549 [Podospora conica]|nr:hypothetical protein QBC39DRAFT_373549 [Schizothecium conicum]
MPARPLPVGNRAIKVHSASRGSRLGAVSTGVPEQSSSSIHPAASMPGERAALPKARAKVTNPDPDPDPNPDSGPVSTAASADSSDDFWAIRGILAEKKVKGRLHYQVDWEDHPETGEVYAPTWEPAKNVTHAAIAAWNDQKRAKRNLTSLVASIPATAARKIVVAIPHPPSFSPSEYRAVSISPVPSLEQLQLKDATSQTTIPDSQAFTDLLTDAGAEPEHPSLFFPDGRWD